MKHPNLHPPSQAEAALPRIALRLGVAGKGDLRGLLPRSHDPLSQIFTDIFQQIEGFLCAIQDVDDPACRRSCIDFFDKTQRPELRLVCGLAQGTDAKAVDAFIPDRTGSNPIERTFQAVLPFSYAVDPFRTPTDTDDPNAGIVDYDFSFDSSTNDGFDRRLNAADMRVVADGIFDPKPDEYPDLPGWDDWFAQHHPSVLEAINQAADDEQRAEVLKKFFEKLKGEQTADRKHIRSVRRRRGHRCQSALLLRQIDILIAAVDPFDRDLPGGTLETIRAAQKQKLPILLICLKRTDTSDNTPHLKWVLEDDDLEELRVHSVGSDDDARLSMMRYLSSLLTNDRQFYDRLQGNKERHPKAEYIALLKDLFEPPCGQTVLFKREKGTIHNWLYEQFKKATTAPVRPKKQEERKTQGGASDEIPCIAQNRKAIKKLNEHYTGRYRGSFLLNAIFVILALAAAVIRENLESADVSLNQYLVSAQIIFVSGILINSVVANGGFRISKKWVIKNFKVFSAQEDEPKFNRSWNRKAILSRYVMERMRSLFYLPRLGHLRPPSVTKSRSMSNDLETSALDWLLLAWIRELKPTDMPGRFNSRAVLLAEPTHLKFWQADLKAALNRVKDAWISHETNGQTVHHAKNAEEQGTMDRSLQFGVTAFNGSAILALSALLGYITIGYDAKELPVLLIFGTVLPVLASILSTIRYLTEASRLSERSKNMALFLKDKGLELERLNTGIHEVKDIQSAGGEPAIALIGGHTHSALDSVSLLASDMIEEVSDWSVVYRKEVEDS